MALWGCGAQDVLLWCPDEDARTACPSGATPCADETELLTVLCRRIRELDPDVLTGWSIIDFDVPVLIRRAASAGVVLNIGRAPGELRQRDGGNRRFSDSIFIPGRTVLDGIRLLRAVGLRLPDYSLEAASCHILGEGKTFTPSITLPRSSAPMRGIRSGSCGTTSPTRARASPSTSWRN